MPPEIYIFDLIGTFVFAFYGGYVAIKKRCDILGILMPAFLSAVGGGTMRELLLNNIPFYFFDNNYVFIILGGSAAAVILYPYFSKVEKYVQILDGIGLAIFAFTGAAIAAQNNLGIFGITFFAIITATGGGILRDISLREIPKVFYQDFYATPAMIVGLVYSFIPNAYFVIALGSILRLFAMHKKFHLWKPHA